MCCTVRSKHNGIPIGTVKVSFFFFFSLGKFIPGRWPSHTEREGEKEEEGRRDTYPAVLTHDDPLSSVNELLGPTTLLLLLLPTSLGHISFSPLFCCIPVPFQFHRIPSIFFFSLKYLCQSLTCLTFRGQLPLLQKNVMMIQNESIKLRFFYF